MTNSIGSAAEQGGDLVPIAIVIAVAALLGLGFLWLRQPPLVGFILAGVALGPTGAGVVASSGNVALLAEMGVVVLLFFIGMELSIKAFMLTLRQALLVMSGQLLAAMALAIVIALVVGASSSEAIILGFIIGMSSTVVAMKMLEEMDALRGEAGRLAIGVLIAQDLAVVPILIFVTSLGGGEVDVTAIMFKVVIAVTLMGWLMWWLSHRGKLRIPFAEQVEHKVEILALGSLAVCFAAAAISGVAGLSPVYGAFLAGIVAGNSTLRSRVIPVIEPIQSILLVVFFLSIGLLIDLDFIWDHLWAVFAVSLMVLAAKTVLNIFLLRKTGSPPQTALVAGLSMAQIGEFSFVLAAAGLSAGGLRLDLYRLAIAVTAVSLLVSPICVGLMHRLENMANEKLQTYRQMLGIAYSHEIHEMSRGRDAVARGLHGLRVRYRAIRLALYHSRKARRSGRN
ncbi:MULTISPECIES: cation:proton antiporter [unclassified Sinorhizobium]|uniref:cation:proton antiporter domain-containing protein n=1 Tax=unclassified Sinorhizobium TaxID=2613772 RepID=UPI0035244281